MRCLHMLVKRLGSNSMNLQLKIKLLLYISICCFMFLCGCGKHQNATTANIQQRDLFQKKTNQINGQLLEDQLFEAIDNQSDLEFIENKLEATVKQLIAQGVNTSAINNATHKAAQEIFNGDQGTMTISPASCMAWTEYGCEKYYNARRNILWLLIDAGNALDDDEWLIHQIVKSGNIEFVELMIKKEIDLTKYEDVLLDAANSGNERVFNLVFSLISDANYQDKAGNSVLMEAVGSHFHIDVPRSEAIVKFLLDHSADVNHKNKNGRSVLECAIQSGNENIVKMLLQNHISLKEEPKTLIHSAVACSNTNIVKLMLDNGFSLEEKDEIEQTPLHWAAGSNAIGWRNNADPKMVQFLLQNGAHVNAQDKYGRTPLISHIDCTCELYISIETIVALLEFGADRFIKCNDGKTAIDRLLEISNGGEYIGKNKLLKAYNILMSPHKESHRIDTTKV
jgi:ankyrin repeat protein